MIPLLFIDQQPRPSLFAALSSLSRAASLMAKMVITVGIKSSLRRALSTLRRKDREVDSTCLSMRPMPSLDQHRLQPVKVVSFTQQLRQKLSGIRCLACRDLLGSATGDQLAALVASLRAEVDDIIGRFDHV